MKNINDVLKQKEIEYLQLQKEIEALRVAARLLADESDPYAKSSQLRGSTASPNGDSAYAPAWESTPKKFP